MKQQIHFCQSFDGVRIAYATSGSGTPLVRAANWLTHLELEWKSPIWSHWFEQLSRSYRLVRYDIRGSGLSARRVGEMSLDAWVRDLEAVVDTLKLDRFDLLGLCQGGAIAVAYAAQHPDRVNRLVVYDSYLHGAFADGVSARRKREAEALSEMISIGWGRHNSAFRQVFAELLMPEASKDEQRWISELQRQTVSPETAVRLWRAFHQIDIRNLAQRVKIPTLVFHVMGDAMVPFAEGQRLASLIPAARFVPLDGKNHILREDEPAWSHFMTELHSFLGTSEAVAKEQAVQTAFADLTTREREILGLIAQGLSN